MNRTYRSMWLHSFRLPRPRLAVALLGLGVVLGATGRATAGPQSGAGTNPQGDSVTLSPQQMKDRGITVAAAPGGDAEPAIKAPGTAEFIRDRVARIGPLLPAKVIEATVALGDIVKPGQTVAIMDSVALGKVKAGYLTARATLVLKRAQYQREQRLYDQKITSRAELQQARAQFEQARASLNSIIEELRLYGLSRKQVDAIEPKASSPFSRYALTSPKAGVVEQIDITPGQTLTADMTPIEVVDTTRMWVVIDAFEKDVGRIRTGQKLVFRPRALAGAQFSGTVNWIAAALSAKTRTVQVRATVDNPRGSLRAGMFGSAEIQVGADDNHAVLPADAIQTVDGQVIVFKPVKGRARTFTAVPVKTGDESGGQVEIVSGLRPGDPVVLKGSFALMSILTAGSRQDD